MNNELLELLRCPRTGKPLQLHTDAGRVAETNRQINNRQMAMESREALPEPVEALLCSEDGSCNYPVSQGMAWLLSENNLVAASDGKLAEPVTPREAAIQREQMAKYSAVYERWTGGEDGITRATQSMQHQLFGELFANTSVLDIGNGGTPADVQLGPEIAAALKQFIAADKSPDMLSRSGVFGDLLLADAFDLPFDDDAVDIVTVNNTMHHFGRRRGDDPQAIMRGFFSEALRVARKAVVGVELLVPSWGLLAETMLVNTIGYMPTFVYSANFYRRMFRQAGYNTTIFEAHSLSQLTSPWRIIPPVLDYTWLRVPTFVIPYSFLFFAIEKHG